MCDSNSDKMKEYEKIETVVENIFQNIKRM